jgi:hypothetical protein
VTISSPPTELTQAAAELLGPIHALEAVGGGRNSRVYRLTTANGPFALKQYFRDGRNRADTEFYALLFLWRQGVRAIPQPIATSLEHGFAVYEWIDGEPADPAIGEAVAFLIRLSTLRSGWTAPAAEACFSGRALVDQLYARLSPLQAEPRLSSFLNDELVPAIGRFSQVAGIAELPDAARVLSPSDFGFHNALRRRGGELVFLDFEYFGWDDPAKTVSDFLLHPAMSLTLAQKREFAAALDRALPAAGLARRLPALYPLFGLKWCLILLNEFLPDHLQRRRFAGMTEAECHQRQEEQLEKCRAMLQRVWSEYEPFPYLG